MNNLTTAAFFGMSPLLDYGVEPQASTRLYPTGIPSLDNLFGGGILPGKIVAVYGAQRTGKTSFVRTMYLANFSPKRSRREINWQEGDQDYLHIRKWEEPPESLLVENLEDVTSYFAFFDYQKHIKTVKGKNRVTVFTYNGNQNHEARAADISLHLQKMSLDGYGDMSLENYGAYPIQITILDTNQPLPVERNRRCMVKLERHHDENGTLVDA